MAVTLIYGGLTGSALTDAHVRSPAVRDLAARVDVAVDPDLDAGYPDGRPSSVTLVLGDGSIISATSLRPRGDADGAASRRALQDKSRGLLREAFGDQGDALLRVLAQWPTRHTPRELGAAFREAARATAEARR